jgi:hypothetical protein
LFGERIYILDLQLFALCLDQGCNLKDLFMMMTVVAMLCQVIASLADPVCHEVIVTRQEMTMQRCMSGMQIGIADWKGKSIYKSDKWTVEDVQCVPGDSYQPKDAI